MSATNSKKAPKQYPLRDSPFFRIKGKRRFEAVLGVSWDSCEHLSAPEHYRSWLNANGREIQNPLGWMKHIHHRIADLFSRIQTPDYLHSRKGRSYAGNAAFHAGSTPLFKTDISKFYPSTTHAMVYRMFVRDFECDPEVAQRLADICCYQKKHVPTGSELSGRIAFWSAKPMFDKVFALAQSSSCEMTLYVDDIVISGDQATKSLLGQVRQIVSQYGFKTKAKKSITYAANQAKTVTGVVVVGDELRLPNSRHRKIWEARKAYANGSQAERPTLKAALVGRMREADQILKLNVQNPSACLASENPCPVSLAR